MDCRTICLNSVSQEVREPLGTAEARGRGRRGRTDAERLPRRWIDGKRVSRSCTAEVADKCERAVAWN